MPSDEIYLEVNGRFKVVELGRAAERPNDPAELDTWRLSGIRTLQPSWVDVPDSEAVTESDVVHGTYGYETAPLRLVGLLTSSEGLHRFKHPHEALVDDTLTRGVRLIVDAALDDSYGEYMDAQLTARKVFAAQATYQDGEQKPWEHDLAYTHLMIAMAERGQRSSFGEHSNKFDPTIYWPGMVASMLCVAKHLNECQDKTGKRQPLIRSIIMTDFKKVRILSGLNESQLVGIQQQVINVSADAELASQLN